jgi:two-component system, OmpR family, response regulator RpaA
VFLRRRIGRLGKAWHQQQLGDTMGDLILVVDDDPEVAEAIERILRRSGFEISIALNGTDALVAAGQQRPDLMILDIIMPGLDGIEVGRAIRHNADLADLPILFLTGRQEISDKVAAYQQALADDYLTKPFDVLELDLRVKALLRRARQHATQEVEERIIQVGDLTLDLRNFEIRTPDRTVLLTPVEFELMTFLMSSADQVFSADVLLQRVWGYPVGTGMPDLVRVHVKNIRDKIEPDPRQPIYLRNVLRRGYMISSRKATT